MIIINNLVLCSFKTILFTLIFIFANFAHAGETLTNVWKKNISIIAEPTGNGYFRLTTDNNKYFHIENGKFEIGKIKSGWWSAQWKMQKHKGFVRLQNRWKPEIYLHTEKSNLDAGKIKLGWWSARWKKKSILKESTIKLRSQFSCSEPNNDGCSNPLKDPSAKKHKKIFRPACEIHDRCYSSPWRLSGETGYKGMKKCDDEFKRNMDAICNSRGSTSTLSDCKIQSITFYETVKDWGHKPYDNGQDTANRICTDKSKQVKNGAVRFFNTGGYVADVRLSYTYKGKKVKKTKDIAIGTWIEWSIPEGATHISLIAYSYTALFWEPRREIVSKNWGDKPKNKCFKLYGTTLSPKYNNVCDLFER